MVDEKQVDEREREQERTKPADAPPPPPPPPERRRKSRKGLFIVGFLALIAAVGGFLWWQYSNTYESTDDAIVDGHLNAVASRITGTVTAVHAEENQFVKQGQLLVELDPRDYEVALEQARAALTQSQSQIQAENPNIPLTQTTSATNISNAQADVAGAEAGVASAEGEYQAALARLREAEANNVKAQADVARFAALVAKDEVPRQQYDQVVATAKASAATVDAARANADAALKVVEQRRAQTRQASTRLEQANQTAPQNLAISRANVQSRRASALGAQAAVDRAQLDLSYTKIVAPVSGIVSRRSVEVGTRVQPGQQLMTVAQLDDIWITANFKETQLKRMHPGQSAEIKVDAFDMKLDGYVESMPAASGAISSLLPPENATGNYVKVVQRLPVRIRIKKGQPGLDRLRPGMSVEPKVWLK